MELLRLGLSNAHRAGWALPWQSLHALLAGKFHALSDPDAQFRDFSPQGARAPGWAGGGPE